MLEKAGGQPAQQRGQAGLQLHNLVGGQTLDKLLRQHFLRSAQGLGLDAMQASQRHANRLGPIAFEPLREQEGNSLFGQLNEALTHSRRAVRYMTGSRDGFVPTVGDGITTTEQGLVEL